MAVLFDVDQTLEETVQMMGFDGLKVEQKEAISAFLLNKDVFVALPTGFGKSLCYGCLPLVYDRIRQRNTSIVLIISPLIALMKDQAEIFKSKGVRAIRDGEHGPDVTQNILEGHYQLVYISPEAILTRLKWRRMLLSKAYQENLVALIIDEAHCVKKWGDDFRVHYSRLRELRSLIPSSVGVMALTATASDSLISDIIEDTGMLNPYIVQASPDKENLRYFCEINSIDDFFPLIESLQRDRISFRRTIIYCQRQIDCGHLFQLFHKKLGPGLTEPPGLPFNLPQYRVVDCFTKGTQEEVKDIILRNYTQLHSVLRVVICTTAFGMGIDCVNVTRNIHWGPPNDIETYIQQTGRSGRSAETSFCVMLHGKGLMRCCDKKITHYTSNTTLCRRTVLFSDFKLYRSHTRKCNCCDICAKYCNCVFCYHLLQSNNMT